MRIFQNLFRIEKMDLLIAVYIFCVAVSELMGAKTFPLLTIGTFHLNASVAIFVVPLVFSINDMITEVHGAEKTRSIIRSGLVVVFLIFLTSLFFTLLPPSPRFAGSEAAYDAIFGFSARMSAASLLAFGFSEFLDVFVFMKVKKMFHGKSLWLRTNLSNFFSQFTDTVIFMVFAFYAFDKGFGANMIFLTGLIIPYWLLKCAMSVIETPLVYLGVKWLKKVKS